MLDPEIMGLIDDEEDEAQEDDFKLGPCGCTDYHMADCGLVTRDYDDFNQWWRDDD